MEDNEILVFPTNFKFGTSTAAFQVEGDSGERKTDWDDFLKANPGIVRHNEKGPQWWVKGKAEEDLNSMSEIGMKVQRIGFEWGRIEPEKGVINYNAINRYKELIDEIIKLGMSPLVTLNHFTLPAWIAKEGSWEAPHIALYFERFTELMVAEFPQVTHWITINEPNILTVMGYFTKYFPPQRGTLRSAIKARHNMIMAHRRSYHKIKDKNPNAKAGVAFAFRWDRAASASDPFERLYTKFVNYLSELSYVDAMVSTSDFIGCNFYTGYFLNLNLLKWKVSVSLTNRRLPEVLLFGEVKTPDAYESEYRWPIVPDFLLNTLHVLNKDYKLPILITENGIADGEDKYRAFYTLTHLVAVWRALHEGIPIRHYFHWATVDNIEWLEGYSKQFGLLGLDPVTGKRQLRKSALLYKEIATTGKIDINFLVKNYIHDEKQKEKAYQTIRMLLRGELSRRIKRESPKV